MGTGAAGSVMPGAASGAQVSRSGVLPGVHLAV
jgi:hypothetical protein